MSTKTSKYRNYGLVRLKNLSDLEDVTAAVNNLLNNLPVTVEGKTFISEDLDVIRGVKNLPVNTRSFRQLVGAATTTDTLDPNTGFVNTQIVNPIITLKDQRNRLRSYTGTPGTFGSGDGLNTWFLRPENINQTATDNTTWDDLFTVDYKNNANIPSENFWSNGEFQFNTKFYETFNPGPGGMVFEGYWILNQENFTFLNILSKGRLRIEVQEQDSADWISAINWVNSNGNYANVEWNFAAPDPGFFAFRDIIGDEIINQYHGIYPKHEQILTFDGVDVSDLNLITNSLETGSTFYTFPMDQETLAIVYSRLGIPNDGSNGSFVGSITSITTKRLYGNTGIQENFQQGIIDIADIDGSTKYLTWPENVLRYLKIRIFYWLTENDGDTNILRILYGTDPLWFWNFSTIEPDTTSENPYYIRNILENATTLANPKFGLSDDPKDLTSESNILSNYVPVSAFGTLIDVVPDLEQTDNYSFILAPGSNSSTSGDWILPQDPADVSFFSPFKIAVRTSTGGTTRTELPEFQGSTPAYKASKDGLIELCVGSATNDIVTLTQQYLGTARFTVDNLVFVPGETSPYRIIETISETSFRVNTDIDGTTGWFFIYSSSGIVDASKIDFCRGVVGKKVTSTVLSGSSALPVTDTTGLVIGQHIQFDGGIAPGTVIGSFDSLTNTVELVNEIDNSIALTFGDIPIESFITFVPNSYGGDINRESCVLPLDVSPPFLGTEEGLDSNGNSIRSTFVSTNGFNVQPAQLESENSVVTQVTTEQTYSTRIEFTERDVEGTKKYYYIIANKL